LRRHMAGFVAAVDMRYYGLYAWLAQRYAKQIGDTDPKNWKRYIRRAEALYAFDQQRHLFAHQQGIVDADYLTRSGDTTYAVGQRLLIKPASVLEFADLIERLGNALFSRLNP
ncbi:hypothetical protein, partial [Solirhodobacter olei]|uniref:hypothetical protein n=1 Tax=Solirhodobacter olei TaxID=2493082 RepID=UPI0019D4415E